MWPDRVSNPGPLTYESGALPIVLRGPAFASSQPFTRPIYCPQPSYHNVIVCMRTLTIYKKSSGRKDNIGQYIFPQPVIKLLL